MPTYFHHTDNILRQLLILNIKHNGIERLQNIIYKKLLKHTSTQLK